MDESPVTEAIDDAAVDDALDEQLRDLFSTCFPREACFQHQRFWRVPPMRRWFIRAGESRLAAHVCIHALRLGSDAGDLRVGGIAEVCVRPEFRGQGLVRRILADVHQWLGENGYEFAMLFGAEKVYSSSGYVKIDNILRSADWPGEKITEARSDSSMIRQLGQKTWPAGLIDLRGPIF